MHQVVQKLKYTVLFHQFKSPLRFIIVLTELISLTKVMFYQLMLKQQYCLKFLYLSFHPEEKAVPFELDLRKQKLLLISVYYRPPSNSLTLFSDSLAGMIYFFSSPVDNFVIVDNLNVQPVDSTMKDFTKVNFIVNLIKGPASFKEQGCCIDIILINWAFTFKRSNSYETHI